MTDDLDSLRVLYSRRASIHSTDERRAWLAEVTAIVAKYDPARAESIRIRIPAFTSPVSEWTRDTAWETILQAVVDVIAGVESKTYQTRSQSKCEASLQGAGSWGAGFQRFS